MVEPDGVLDGDHGETVAVWFGVGHGQSDYPDPIKATQPFPVQQDAAGSGWLRDDQERGGNSQAPGATPARCLGGPSGTRSTPLTAPTTSSLLATDPTSLITYDTSKLTPAQRLVTVIVALMPSWNEQ